ncbi:hypothetical protein [Roseiconus lacunae]|uniref:Uncharacterized protein n=1 Tax=Roseiconus lacunae TaxID=2605694 RepID=A0ABT7PEH5_9BACT|nr:hypothetical protein [Roseiconus lacunae]MDM4014626.1 hypothetical protein [Roseiconus lacunae]
MCNHDFVTCRSCGYGLDRASVIDAAPRYYLSSDSSGHDFIIPVDRADEWEAFLDLPEDDPASWDPPAWATMTEGFTFIAPRQE